MVLVRAASSHRWFWGLLGGSGGALVLLRNHEPQGVRSGGMWWASLRRTPQPHAAFFLVGLRVCAQIARTAPLKPPAFSRGLLRFWIAPPMVNTGITFWF